MLKPDSAPLRTPEGQAPRELNLQILPSAILPHLPSCHPAILPSCHPAILPSCHPAILPSCHPAIQTKAPESNLRCAPNACEVNQSSRRKIPAGEDKVDGCGNQAAPRVRLRFQHGLIIARFSCVRAEIVHGKP
jgi:hypothetical protein